MAQERNTGPEQTDRVALVVADADQVAAAFNSIFLAEIVGDCEDKVVGARRLTLQWGHDQVELFEPGGDGPAAQVLKERGNGIFAGGFAMADPAALAARLQERGVQVHEQGADRFLVLPQDCRGTGIILSRKEERARIGLAERIWQITYAADSVQEMVDYYVDLLDMGGLYTSRYDSELFGYHGGITWFDELKKGAPLDSLEYLEPTDPKSAVARFVKRHGSGIYMCAIQTDDIPEIRERVEAGGRGWDDAGEIGGFIHPSRLGGMLLGLAYFNNYKRPIQD